MLSPLPSPFSPRAPLPSAAAEHSWDLRGELSVRQGESWPLRCTCVLQMAGGCHWRGGHGTSLFLDPELQVLGVGLGALARRDRRERGKKLKKPSTRHMFPWLWSGTLRIGGVQWAILGNAVQITGSNMSECRNATIAVARNGQTPRQKQKQKQKQTEMN